MKHGRFTDCHFLRAIGRNLLKEFFDKFQVAVPPPNVSDDTFFSAVGSMLMTPEGLPDHLNDVLHEIQELSTEQGHERLEAAVGKRGLQLSLGDNATPEELALRVWLSAPDLLARNYNEHRFSKLTSFVFYERDTECLALESQHAGRGDREMLVQRLDAWFAANRRGEETVVVDRYDLAGEEWYLIRHGDTYQRSSKVEKRTMEVVHYRPAKDDLVVYSPQRDELRINAKTKGERDLYKAAFGYYLHGLENYFRGTKTCSLEPLRELGPDALDCSDIPGISKVVLRQVEFDLGSNNQRKTLQADDVFACDWGADKVGLVVPDEARVTQASFVIYVEGGAKPVEVRIKPPNMIRLGKKGPLDCVHEWLSARGFKSAKPNRSTSR